MRWAFLLSAAYFLLTSSSPAAQQQPLFAAPSASSQSPRPARHLCPPRTSAPQVKTTCAASGTEMPAYILYQRLSNDGFPSRTPEAEHLMPGDNTREVAIGVSMTTKLMPIIFI